MANTNKQLTSEEEKLLQKEAEKNNLSKKEIEDVENILKATGGMSEGAQKAFIGILAAVSGAALGTGLTYAIMKHNKKSNNDQQDSITITIPLNALPENLLNKSSSNSLNDMDLRNLDLQNLGNLSPETQDTVRALLRSFSGRD